MTKTVSILLSALLLLGLLAGCGKDAANTNQTQAPETGVAEPGGENANQFEKPGDAASPLDGKSLSSIVDLIYQQKDSGLRVSTTDIDLENAESLKYYTGLSSADQLKEAVASEALIGSQAYSLVLVRVKDSSDASSVAQSMKSGVDPAKWICVMADDLQVAGKGDVALLIMVETALADSVTASQIVSAFSAVAGGLDF